VAGRAGISTAPLVSQFWWQAEWIPGVFWTILRIGWRRCGRDPSSRRRAWSRVRWPNRRWLFALPLGLWFLWTSPRPFKRFWLFIWIGTVLALTAWLPILTADRGYFWLASVLFHTAKRTRPWYAFVIIYRYLPSAFMLAALAAATRAVLTRPLTQLLGDRWWLGFTFALVTDSLLLVKDGSYAHYALTAVASILIGCFAREMIGASKRTAPYCLAMFSIVASFPMFMGLRGQTGVRSTSTRRGC
jgi:hypothetical protein